MELSGIKTTRWVVQNIDSQIVRTVKAEATRFDVRIAVFLEEAVQYYCNHLVETSAAQYDLMSRSQD